MGGRGASSSIGKASAMGSGTPLPPQANAQTKVDDTQTASAFSTDYNAFMAMTDDQKADVISNAIKQGVAAHLAQNDFQRFVANSGLNDKPDIVSDATLDSMNGTEIFRTVNSHYDKANDINYTAQQIAKQVMGAKTTRVSDNGGSVYGRGIYFASSYSHSTSAYGNTRGNVKATAVMRAKLNNNAKVINHSSAVSGANKEISSGSKLGRVLSKCDSASQASIYAMSKGYNVITSGHGYYNVLNRNAITMSTDIKASSTKWK